MNDYPKMMEKIRQRRKFTDEEIVSLQKDIDEWYADWVSVTGREGIINYVHMLGAGHLAYYLENFRNLYQFSNQSWERLNKRVKMYLQHIQKGGHGKRLSVSHMEVEQCPHAKPLAKQLLTENTQVFPQEIYCIQLLCTMYYLIEYFYHVGPD